MSSMLKTDESQVVLRPVVISDAELLMELNNDPEIAKYVVGTPCVVTLTEQMQWMERIASERNVKRFVVEYSGLAIGTIIISEINYPNLTANLNIKLLKSARGKGIGKQSVKLALQYCFDCLEMSCITAHVLEYNKASLALFESCGFVREGVLRSRVIKQGKRFDLVSFSIIRGEFG